MEYRIHVVLYECNLICPVLLLITVCMFLPLPELNTYGGAQRKGMAETWGQA